MKKCTLDGLLTRTMCGDEQFYLASEVDATIAGMRKTFEISSTDEENRLRARVAELEAALRQFAECNLNEGNCASLEVATSRIRNIARKALGL